MTELHRFTEEDRVVKDDKYIVFKRDEYARWFHAIQNGITNDPELPRFIPDAVVIRTQDVFAGPALHSYAASIGIAVSLLNGNDVPRLSEIADYFHRRALEADASIHKLPD